MLDSKLYRSFQMILPRKYVIGFVALFFFVIITR